MVKIKVHEVDHRGLFQMGVDFLKFEDMFAAGIQLKMHRKVKKNPKDIRHVPSLGSVYGGCLTLVFRFILMFYIYEIMTKMANRSGDSI